MNNARNTEPAGINYGTGVASTNAPQQITAAGMLVNELHLIRDRISSCDSRVFAFLDRCGGNTLAVLDAKGEKGASLQPKAEGILGELGSLVREINYALENLERRTIALNQVA